MTTPDAIAQSLKTAERYTDRKPSDAAKEAGNYQKGKFSWHGETISVENPKGSTRSGTDKGGKRWEVKLPATYGYILGTQARDHDHVDCYVGDDHASKKVWVIDQVDDKGRYDEPKCLLSFPSREEAVKTYINAFSDNKGRDRIGSVTEMSIPEFRAWANSPAAKKPLAKGYAIGGSVPMPIDKSLDTARRYAKKANGGRAGYEDGGMTPREVAPLPLPRQDGIPGFLNRLAGDGPSPSRAERAKAEAQRVMDLPTNQFLMEAAPAAVLPALAHVPKSIAVPALAGLASSLIGGDKGEAGEAAPNPRAAEIAKLQTEIAKHQTSIAQTLKDIAGTKFRGVGEEAGMARQKALEEATRPYNDAIAQAQGRIAQLRAASDEEGSALGRAERGADQLRRQELARGKPFNQTPVGEQWEKLGPLAPAAVGAAASFLGRMGHGPKAGWKLPVAEGTGAGALATNVPTAWDAFFSPVGNPERKAYQTYGQELKLAQHPRAQEFLDYANTLPQYNPVREDAQKEFFDPVKAAERLTFGAGEGLAGAGMGLASASGLERMGRGIKALSGSRSSGTTPALTQSPAAARAELPGSLGTAGSEPIPLPAMPQSRMLPSASQNPIPLSPLPQREAVSSRSAAKSSSAPDVVYRGKDALGRTFHKDEAGLFTNNPKASKSSSAKDTAKPLSEGKGNGSRTEKGNGKAVVPEDESYWEGKLTKGQKDGGFISRALETARRFATGGKVTVGPIVGKTGGRTDALPISVPAGSFVLPADAVSALGEGNSLAGNHAIEKMFGKSRDSRAAGGAIPIKISDGEHVLDPEQVARFGGGDINAGHRKLDQLVLDIRKKHIAQLSSLPGPAR